MVLFRAAAIVVSGVIFLVHLVTFPTAESTSNSIGSISPINDLQASLTASASHGSVVAIEVCIEEDHDEVDENVKTSKKFNKCVLLLSRSSLIRRSTDSNDEGNASSVSSPGSSSSSLQQSGDRGLLHVLHPGTSIAVGTTGFAPDVNHVVKCAAADLLQHLHVFGDHGSPLLQSRGNGRASGPKITRRLVEFTCQRLRSATSTNGGRALGVQMVWASVAPSSSSSLGTTSLYTVDPVGGWRYWGGGATAIGRHAEAIRAALYQRIVDNQDHELSSSSAVGAGWNLDEALSMAIGAIVSAYIEKDKDIDEKQTDDDMENDRNLIHEFRALLVTKRGCYELSQDRLQEMYRNCLTAEEQKVKEA